jgi:hypothetical protein
MNIDQWAQLAIDKGAKCWGCGSAVSQADLRNYDHPEGWRVDGFAQRQWLSFECSQKRCRYGTSFTAYEIPRQLQCS